MNYNLIWQAALIIFVGTFLLRLAGRKTLSQMTLAEAVLMLSIGTHIKEGVQPAAKSDLQQLQIST